MSSTRTSLTRLPAWNTLALDKHIKIHTLAFTVLNLHTFLPSLLYCPQLCCTPFLTWISEMLNFCSSPTCPSGEWAVPALPLLLILSLIWKMLPAIGSAVYMASPAPSYSGGTIAEHLLKAQSWTRMIATWVNHLPRSLTTWVPSFEPRR